MAEPLIPPPADAGRYAIAPDSIVWRRASDARTMFGAGTALLLQVAHPTVGAGVAEHSDFVNDPWGRLYRTLDYVNLLVYGSAQEQAQTGVRMRAMHKQIKGTKPDGTRYHALEPEAYAWVHATLAYSIVKAHRYFGRPLSSAETRDFYDQWLRVGRLLGIRARDLPPTWRGFGEYVDTMVAERLEPNPTVDVVLDTLAAKTPPPFVTKAQWGMARPPAAHVVRLGAIALLPRAMRTKLDLELSAAQRAELTVMTRAARATTPLLPGPLRCFGPLYLGWRRAQINRGPFGAPASERIAA